MCFGVKDVGEAGEPGDADDAQDIRVVVPLQKKVCDAYLGEACADRNVVLQVGNVQMRRSGGRANAL